MSAKDDGRGNPASLRRGQLVGVRSLGEILATLDADGKLEGMPFMPEMVPFCGKTFRVFRRAERTCVETFGMRSMNSAVFLDGLRCDGSAHGGCQRGCLFFWKEAWLQPARESAVSSGQSAVTRGERREERGEGEALPTSALRPSPLSNQQSTIDNQRSSANPQSLPRQQAVGSPQSQPSRRTADCRLPTADSLLPTMKGDRFCCQSTELGGGSSDLPPGKLRHFLHDIRIGEMSPGRFAYLACRALLNRGSRLLRGRPFYRIRGEQRKTSSAGLNLQAGELVEIKSLAEIEATLDALGRNRGLSFESEMALHCGRRYRVATPLHTIISEETGKLVRLSDTVILEGLVCRGICTLNCPRANYFFWRDAWLRRVEG